MTSPMIGAALAPDHAVVIAATLTVGFGAAAAWQLIGKALRVRRHRRLLTGAQQVVITPPPTVEADGAAAFWANLHGLLTPSRRRQLWAGAPHVGLEYRWAGRQLQILLWVPGTTPAAPIAAAVTAAWPSATTRIEPATTPLPGFVTSDSHEGWHGRRSSRVTGGALVLARAHCYPLATDHESDPKRALLGAATHLHSTEAACVQVLARPASPRQIADLRTAAAAAASGRLARRGLPEAVAGLVAGILTVLLSRASRAAAAGRTATPDPLQRHAAAEVLTKTARPQWEIALRYAVVHTAASAGGTTPRRTILLRLRRAKPDTITRRLITLAHAIASAHAVYAGANRFRTLPLAHPQQVLADRRLHRGFLLDTTELAALAGLPTDLAVPGLDRARAKTVPASITVPGGGRGTKVLGRAAVGGHAVALPVVDARHHVHVLGSTGVGKSTLLAHLVRDDIRAGRGVVLIDPKGDLALDVQARIPANALERLVVIDPDQPTKSATLNPLEIRTGGDEDLIVDNIVSIFAAIFQRHWGPRIDDVMRVACLTVMRHPAPSLLTVPPLLNDKQFRASFTVDLTDPEGLKGFWEWFEATPPALRAQVTGPVLARLRSFLLRDFVRATIGPARSSFDMTRILDGGGILIARLPKGQLGEETSRLLGSMIFASAWQAATARTRQPEPRRRDATVVIDEAHNILNLAGSVNDMLAEARGYHLSLVLAHQHLAQLPRDTQLAISANARNKIYFTCSPEDAHALARHTLPELDEHDLAHLDAYTAASRLVTNGRENPAFTLRTNDLQPPQWAPAEATRRSAMPLATTRPTTRD